MSFKKVGAVFFSCMLLSSCLLTPWSEAQAAQTPELAWLASLTPSIRFGSVVKSYQSPQSSKGLVVLLEDLHFNRSVQRNIVQLIKFYNERFPTAPIGVEGAAGALDYRSLKSHYRPENKKKLVNFLIENGEITGPEAYAVSADEPLRLIGVENEKYYQYHLQLFRQSYGSRMQLHREVAELISELKELKHSLRRSDVKLREGAREASYRLQAIEAVLSEHVTLEEASAVARDLPQTVDLIQRLQPTLPHPVSFEKAEIADVLQAGLDFYAAASLRDGPLAQNALRLLRGQSATLLVAGGFHAPGIVDALKQAGVSYVVVMPHLAEQTAKDEMLYMRRLLGGHVDPSRSEDDPPGAAILGVTGSVLSPEGIGVLDAWNRQEERETLFPRIWHRMFPPKIPTRDANAPPIEPQWHPGMLESTATLYAWTRTYIQYRIDRYAFDHRLKLTEMADLAQPAPGTSSSEGVTVAMEASSDIQAAGLDASKDLAVSPIDITFNPSEVSSELKKHAAEMLLKGRILHQLIMAGEGTRMRNAVRQRGLDMTTRELEALYFLDPGFLNGKGPKTAMLGPREILQIRYQIEQLAAEYGRELGITVSQALRNQKFEVHANSKTAYRIELDWIAQNFYGFDPQNIVFTPQHINYPFLFENGRVDKALYVDDVAFGSGWPMLESVMGNRSYRILQGKKAPLDLDALFYFSETGAKIVHQYRIDDLYNLSADAIDLEYLAKEIEAIESGRTNFVVRMVANPKGKKGGIPLTVIKKGWEGGALMLADTLAASDRQTKAFLAAVKTEAPYHRFANTYAILPMRGVLRRDGLRPDFELKNFVVTKPTPKPYMERQLINPQYVAGMLATVKDLNALTIHKVGEQSRDWKDMSNIDEAEAYWGRQLAQPGFDKLTHLLRPYTDPYDRERTSVTYRPSHVLLSLLFPLGLTAVPAFLFAQGSPVLGALSATLVGIALAVGVAKQRYVIRALSNEGLHGGGLFRALFREKPVETYDRATGLVTGLTGIVPLAHTARSHTFFRNEFGAHALDVITIPLEAVYALMVALLRRLSPPLGMNREELMHSPLIQALMPAKTSATSDGRIYLPPIPSRFSDRLERVFKMSPQERSFLQHAREKMAAAA